MIKLAKDAFENPVDTVLWTSSMLEQNQHGIGMDADSMRLVAAIIEDGLIPAHRLRRFVVDGKQHLVMAAFDPFGRYQRAAYELMADGAVRRFAPAPPPDPDYVGERLLAVPFQPQRGAGADWSRNDCGEACVTMAVNYAHGWSLTVDEVAKRTKDKRHWYSSMDGLMKALRVYGVGSDHVRPFPIQQIKEAVVNGNPVIALVNYGAWPQELKEVAFDGAHFVLIVGVAMGHVTVHDPLASAPSVLSDEQLSTVMADPPGSMAYQGIIVNC